MLLEHGDGTEGGSDDLNLHDRMQGRSKKQGTRGDLQAVFSLPCAMCKTKAKRVSRIGTHRSSVIESNDHEDGRTEHARSRAKRE